MLKSIFFIIWSQQLCIVFCKCIVMSKSVNSAVFSSYSIEAKVCLSYTFSTGSASSQKSISKSRISVYYPKYKCKLSRYYCYAKCMIQCAVPHSDCQTSGPTWSSCKKDLLFSQLFNIRWKPISNRLGALVFVSLTTKRANTLAICLLIRLEVVILWNWS